MNDAREEILLDLSIEKPDQLEATEQRFGAEWRRHGFRKVTVAGAIFAAAVTIGIIAWIAGAFKGPGSTIIIIAWIFFAGISLFQLIDGLMTVFSYPPKAGITPEETISKYMQGPITKLITLSGKIGTPAWLQSYICLLDQTKARFASYGDFVNYFGKTIKDINDQLIMHYAPRKISSMTCELEKPERIAEAGHIFSYQVAIKVEAMEGTNNPGLSKAVSIGSARVVGIVDIVCIGQRWYLISPYFHGKVEGLKA